MQSFVALDFGLDYTYNQWQGSALRKLDYNFRELPIQKMEKFLKLFDYLIYNTDRHPGNKGQWIAFNKYPKNIEPGQGSGLVAFDNSAALQSFHSAKGNFPPQPAASLRIPYEEVADFLTALQRNLTEEVIKSEMKGYFSEYIIQQTLQRRYFILKFYKMVP